MMKAPRTAAAIIFLIAIANMNWREIEAQSFQNDIVRRVEQRQDNGDGSLEWSLHNELLRAAMPLSQFQRGLEDEDRDDGEEEEEEESEDDQQEEESEDDKEENNNEEEWDYDDDFYIAQDNLYSFSGYSLKYAACQPIQRFSEEAVQNGEYSSMVKDDIVILRLCPQRMCSSSRQYGCHYNYAEYAIDVSEYLRIMLKYTIAKRNRLCGFCADCYRRKLEDGDDYYALDDDDGAAVANYDDDYDAGQEDDDCYTYQEDCADVEDWCQGENEDQNGEDGYLDMADYLDYLDCVKVEGQGNYDGGQYWVRPYCDASGGTIKLAPFYDPYCSQFAGKEVNLKEFSGIYFRSSIFEKFYSDICIDCSESNYAPYYNLRSIMCNSIHEASAKCTSNMMYDLFDGEHADDSTECSYIESLRFGTYNENGELFVATYEDAAPEVTLGQKAGLVATAFICFALTLYACYLHHSITNLLLKSLSHSHLLPPSKHRRSNRSVGSRRSKKRHKDHADKEQNYDDWDHTAPPGARIV